MSLYNSQTLDYPSYLNHIQWHPTKPLLATVSDKTCLQIHDTEPSPINQIFVKRLKSSISSIAWPNTGAKLLAIATTDGKLQLVDAGQSSPKVFNFHEYDVVGKNRSSPDGSQNQNNNNNNPSSGSSSHLHHIPKLLWTKNGARIIYNYGREIYGFRFDINTSTFTKIFQKSYLSDVKSMSIMDSINLFCSSYVGDVFCLKDEQIEQIYKLPNNQMRSEIKQVIWLEREKLSPQSNKSEKSENKFNLENSADLVILSDNLTFIKDKKSIFQVKLNKNTKILTCANSKKLIAYFNNEIRLFETFGDFDNISFPFSFDQSIRDVRYNSLEKTLFVLLGNSFRIFLYKENDDQWIEKKVSLIGLGNAAENLDSLAEFRYQNNHPFLALSTRSSLTVCKRYQLLTTYNRSGNQASQINLEQVEISRSGGNQNQDQSNSKKVKISHGMKNISNMDLTENYLLLVDYDGNYYKVFDAKNGELIGQHTAGDLVAARLVKNFVVTIESDAVRAADQNFSPIIVTSSMKEQKNAQSGQRGNKKSKTEIIIRSFQGSAKNNLSMPENLIPRLIDVGQAAGNSTSLEPAFLGLLLFNKNTGKFVIFTYSISQNALMKQISLQALDLQHIRENLIDFENSEKKLPKNLRIENLKVATDGQSLLINLGKQIVLFSFRTNKYLALPKDQNQQTSTTNTNTNANSNAIISRQNYGYDLSDPRLLYVYNEDKILKTYFYVKEKNEILEFETYQFSDDLEVNNDSFTAVRAPYYLLKKSSIAMTNFASLLEDEVTTEKQTQTSDSKNGQLYVEFAYQITSGNIDKAFTIIQDSFKNTSNIWRSLASSCLKTFRFDIAIKALQSIEAHHSVIAIKRALKNPEYDQITVAALLASQLGKDYIHKTIDLYEEAKRFDLMNVYLQDLNIWTEDDAKIFKTKYCALDLCKTHDRIHFKATIHKYAQCRLNNNQKRSQNYLRELIKNTGSNNGKESKTGLFLPPVSTYPDIFLGKELNWGFGQHNFRKINMAENKHLQDRTKSLIACVDSLKSPYLYTWMGHFNENFKEYRRALEYYQKSGDLLKLVTLLVSLDKKEEAKKEIEIFKESKIDEAENLVTNDISPDGNVMNDMIGGGKNDDNNNNNNNNKNDFRTNLKKLEQNKALYKSACFEMGMAYEESEDPLESVRFYQLADAPHSAVRVAKENSLDDLLISLAMDSNSTEDVLEIAEYFEAANQIDKSAKLYIKGGELNKGFVSILNFSAYTPEDTLVDLLEICIETLAFCKLPFHHIAEALSKPLISKLSNLMLKNNRPEKAVEFLARIGDFDSALDILDQYDVDINNQLMTILDNILKSAKNSQNNSEVSRLQARLADQAMQNGHYRLAAQKFSEAGKFKEAIKALCRSGDINEIIKFANRAKQNDVFETAANYLQTADWTSNDDILQSIQTFYQKAKKFGKLSKFMQKYASTQLSEGTNDYGRCLWALKTAKKADSRGKTESSFGVTHSLEIVQKYIDFKNEGKKIGNSTGQSQNIEAENLLNLTEDTDIICKLHTAAFLVTYFDEKNNLEMAKKYSNFIPKDLANRYLSNQLLNKLGLGVNVPRPGTAAYVIEELFN